MNYTIQDQVTALAGMALAVKLVSDIAREGECEQKDYLLLLNTLPDMNPSSVNAVYLNSVPEIDPNSEPDKIPLKRGFETLINMLQSPSSSKNQDHFRYLLGLITLEKKLQKRKDLMAILTTRIDHLHQQIEHFGLEHENITNSIASIYTDTLSTLSIRLQITGQSKYLKITQNAEKIRAILMAGIRSAALFRQTGGRRWHLLLKQKLIQQTANQLLNT
jgi:high frequency lysogenization protein